MRVCTTPKEPDHRVKGWRKTYAKNQIAVDTQKQIILSHRGSQGAPVKQRDAIPHQQGEYKPVDFCVDKAFGQGKVHINEELDGNLA